MGSAKLLRFAKIATGDQNVQAGIGQKQGQAAAEDAIATKDEDLHGAEVTGFRREGQWTGQCVFRWLSVEPGFILGPSIGGESWTTGVWGGRG
jgi:hypothetical protein